MYKISNPITELYMFLCNRPQNNCFTDFVSVAKLIFVQPDKTKFILQVLHQPQHLFFRLWPRKFFLRPLSPTSVVILYYGCTKDGFALAINLISYYRHFQSSFSLNTNGFDMQNYE